MLTVAAVVSALVLATSGGAWAVTTYVTGHLDRLSVGTSGTPESGPLNILVAGVDQRSGLTPQQQHALHVGHDVSTNSDTLMLVHVPADHSYLEVVSLPRDSWVNIPGHGMNKINAAFGLGGPKLMVQTVAAATGLTINDYIEVNFLGFVKVIDALGGVNICLPFAVNDAYSGLRPVRRDPSRRRHHRAGIRPRPAFLRDVRPGPDRRPAATAGYPPQPGGERGHAERPVPVAADAGHGDRGGPGRPGLQRRRPGQRAARHPARGCQLHHRAAVQLRLPDAHGRVGGAVEQDPGRATVRADRGTTSRPRARPARPEPVTAGGLSDMPGIIGGGHTDRRPTRHSLARQVHPLARPGPPLRTPAGKPPGQASASGLGGNVVPSPGCDSPPGPPCAGPPCSGPPCSGPPCGGTFADF